jgi:hypothetical protein
MFILKLLSTKSLVKELSKRKEVKKSTAGPNDECHVDCTTNGFNCKGPAVVLAVKE